MELAERGNAVIKRVRILGVALATIGLAVAGAGFAYGLRSANEGLSSAEAMYQAQDVRLSYNDAGELMDRGTTEGAQKILALLEREWKYPVDRSNLDPSDPVINTRDELMYQYATITYHVLHSTIAVKLAEKDVPITYRGVTYGEAGTYNVTVEKYYAQFDRTNPIERQLREAWTPQALALTSALAGGHANQAAGEIAVALSLATGIIGILFAGAGGGLVWVSLAPAPEVGARRARSTLSPHLVVRNR